MLTRLLLASASFLAAWQLCGADVVDQQFVGGEQQVFNVPESVLPTTKYVVVLDASSMNTRLHLYDFAISPSGLPNYKSKKFFRPNDAGLYSYISSWPGPRNVTAGAESLRPLIEHAKKLIPAEVHPETLLVLRASEILHAHPAPWPQRLMQTIHSWLNKTENVPFKLLSDVAQIIERSDHLAYVWAGMNCVLNPEGNRDVAVITMSRFDTQVAFLPQVELSGYQAAPIQLGDKSYPLFRTSLPGTDTTRITSQILKSLVRNRTDEELEQGHMLASGNGVVPVVPNPCFARHNEQYVTLEPDVKVLLKDEDAPANDPVGPYIMSGKGLAEFELCAELVDEHMRRIPLFNETKAAIPPIPETSRVLLTGAFDAILEPALLSPEASLDASELHVTTVRKIADLARLFCLGAAARNSGYTQFLNAYNKLLEERKPSWCLDLTIVHRILVLGYGLDDSREVMFGQKVKGLETTDWTLGVALKAIMDERVEILRE
uniref:guanosine-diphosphatase n=1 Tax=Mycena chlorophos TaxID=658473 RepID=A0ABQ0L9A7_MYCCL|nr:predicted protein [Mycena chlorophos]